MKKTMMPVWIFLLFFAVNKIFAQQATIDVTIHSRVDTTHKEIKEVAELWTDYLNAKPDSVYDNPHWNKTERIKYKIFDFSMPYLYQFSSTQLFSYYKPTILSIEKEGDHYGIRTIFAADGPQEMANGN